MKSTIAKSLGILGLSLGCLSGSVPAWALDFSFSFNGVSGTITGVPTTGGSATGVSVTGSPIGGTGAYPSGGSFSVSSGNISSASYTGTFSGNTLQFSGTTGTLTTGSGTRTGPVTFSPAGAAAAPWDFNPTVAVVLGAGVWAIASRRKKGIQPQATPTPSTLLPTLSHQSSDAL